MKINNIKRIGIICGYPFPFGLAPTTRILTYSKGLVENNIKVDIFVFFPTEAEATSLPIRGTINGIDYHFPLTRIYPKKKILRKLSHLFFLIITIYYLIKEHHVKRFDLIIISSDWFRILYFFIPVIKLINSKVVFIADEFPVPIKLYLKKSVPSWRKRLFKIILKYVDAMVFMTENLSKFYKEIIVKPSYILPSITDVSRFSDVPITNISDSQRYICYMGNMELSKDNVDLIIEAFYLISNKYPDIDLFLYGDPALKDLKTIEEIITRLSLSERVYIKGKVENSLVPSILMNSLVLVSSQPQTTRAQGGFPTKLGEYLASGIPTLMTDVGEISNYVQNGVHLWLAKPSDKEDYAGKLDYIINNYSCAKQVAENGKLYVLNHFDYKMQSKKFINFLNEIIQFDIN